MLRGARQAAVNCRLPGQLRLALSVSPQLDFPHFLGPVDQVMVQKISS
jgi:hypothetical protein